MTPAEHDPLEAGDCRDEIVCEVAHCDLCDGWVDLEERDYNDGMHRGCREREEAKREAIAWGM